MKTAAAPVTAVFKQHVLRRSLFDPVLEKGTDIQDLNKTRKVVSYKAVGDGKPLTDAQLARINSYAPKALKAEEVYYRSVLLCHNGIDRDNERFSDELLDAFAATAPGKGFFTEGHPGWRDQSPGKGRIFDAHTESIAPEKFLTLTGEKLVLPDGVTMGKVLIIDFYMLKLASNADTQANIDGGIYCFASIGFSAPLYGITDERGNEIYGEYRPKGEALEGSLVWLGAQPGAGAIKSAHAPHQSGQSPDTDASPKAQTGGIADMIKTINSKYGKTFAEGDVAGVMAFIAEKDTQLAAKDTQLAAKESEIASLKAAAADGQAYRKRLVDDTIKAGVLLGDIKTDEASQKAETDFLMTVPVSRLEVMAGKALAAAKEKFPEKFEIPASDQTDREKASQDAAADQGKSVPGKESPLIADAKKRAEAAGKK